MNYKLEVFKKASLCRNFELYTSKFIKTGDIYIPTYVSTGQEFIAASLSILCEKKKSNHYYLVNTDAIQYIWHLKVRSIY